LVDGAEVRANDVFGDCAKRVSTVVGAFDEHQDFGKRSRDGGADPALAGDDFKMAVYFSDERRLDDADGFDVCDELLVGVVAGGGAARIVGIELEGAGIDGVQFHLRYLRLGLRFLTQNTSRTPRAVRRCKGGTAAVARDARGPLYRDRSGAGRGDPPFVAGAAGCGPWLFFMLALPCVRPVLPPLPPR
jgi:hypothetical protein